MARSVNNWNFATNGPTRSTLRLGWGESLDVQGTMALLLRAAQEVSVAEELLDMADQALGGENYGLQLRQGCELACHTLQSQTFASPGAVFIAVGQALLVAASEHRMRLFATIWVAGGKRIAHAAQLNASLFASVLDEGAIAVQKFGRLKLGEKSLLDALVPASRAARLRNRTLSSCLQAAALAACEGAQRTRDFENPRMTGLAEECPSIGKVDPGAIAFSIWVKGMSLQMSEGAVPSVS